MTHVDKAASRPAARTSGPTIDRRTFTAGAAAALLAAPALAQQQRVRRLTMVGSARPVDEMTEAGPPHYRAFFQELRRLGFGEGETLAVERRSGRDQSDPAELARAVVATRPDVIFALGVPAIGRALLAATSTIPIVGFGADFIRFGLVTSLARPGANLTGFTSDAGLESRS